MIGFKKIFDYFTFILIAFLALPTSAILTTWNTLPGEKLYPLKKKLEEVALLIASANFGTKADLHAKIVDRRFQETTELLELSSGIGLPELTKEIDAVKQDIVKQATKTTKPKGAKVVKDKTEKMITQLKEYDQELEKEKQKLTSQTISNTSTAPSQTIVQEVYQTQKEIQVIVKELEVVRERVIIVETQNVSAPTNPRPSPSPSSSSTEQADLTPMTDVPPAISPSPSLTPSIIPSHSSIERSSSSTEQADLTPMTDVPPAISPSPSLTPSIIPSHSSIERSFSPSPVASPEVEGVRSERISFYPLILGAVVCSLIGLFTLLITRLAKN